jgi:hypothetical protein
VKIKNVGAGLEWCIKSMSAMADRSLWQSRIPASTAAKLSSLENVLESIRSERPEYLEIRIKGSLDVSEAPASRSERRDEVCQVLESIHHAVTDEMRVFGKEGRTAAAATPTGRAELEEAISRSPFLLKIETLVDRLASIEFPDEDCEELSDRGDEAATDEINAIDEAQLAETLIASTKRKAIDRQRSSDERVKPPSQRELAIAELDRVVSLIDSSQSASDVAIHVTAIAKRKTARKVEIKPRYRHLLGANEVPSRVAVISVVSAVKTSRVAKFIYHIEWQTARRRKPIQVSGVEALLRLLAREVGEVAASVELKR